MRDTPRAIRATISGAVQGVGFRDAVRGRAVARRRGWVRNAEDGSVAVHAEGPPGAVEALVEFLGGPAPGGGRAEVQTERGRGWRGTSSSRSAVCSAGVFVVREHPREHAPLRPAPRAHRSDALLGAAEGPVAGPADQALAVEVGMHEPRRRRLRRGRERGPRIVWDRGGYEQGGRVPWPEALGAGSCRVRAARREAARRLRAAAHRDGRSPSGCSSNAGTKQRLTRLGHSHRAAGVGAQRSCPRLATSTLLGCHARPLSWRGASRRPAHARRSGPEHSPAVRRHEAAPATRSEPPPVPPAPTRLARAACGERRASPRGSAATPSRPVAARSSELERASAHPRDGGRPSAPPSCLRRPDCCE